MAYNEKGETLCGMCGRDGIKTVALHKVGEECESSFLPAEHPTHNLTQDVCCEHFQLIMGPFAKTICSNVHKEK
jgi:hypothetical protein